MKVMQTYIDACVTILLKMSLGGVHATASFVLASEWESLSNMDEWCIFVIHNVFPDITHLITLVGLIIFLQQYLKWNGAFQA